MKILLLSQWYDPEPIFKIGELARYLNAQGHEVTVITGFPNYPLGRVYSGYKMRLWQWDEIGGVRILRIPLYPSHNNSAISRVLHYLSFAFTSAVAGVIVGRGMDLLWAYSSAPNSGIPAVAISLINKIPFVLEVQDMWPETLAASNIMRPGWKLRILYGSIDYCLRIVYRMAAAIIVISAGFKRNLISKNVPANKIHVIPNWTDSELYRSLPKDSKIAEKWRLADRFNVIFGGNMGLAQNLRNVLFAAEKLKDLPKIQFVFIGDGVEYERLVQIARDRKITNVAFIGRQPTAQMPYFFALADILLVSLAKSPIFDITVPSKITAYMACKKPILCCASGDAADIIRDSGAGAICPPDDPDALSSVVRELYNMPQGALVDMGESAYRAFLSKYQKSVLISKYESVFNDVAGIKP